MRPGLSGLAQVNGRNAISWEDKFKYDIQDKKYDKFVCVSKAVSEQLEEFLSDRKKDI